MVYTHIFPRCRGLNVGRVFPISRVSHEYIDMAVAQVATINATHQPRTKNHALSLTQGKKTRPREAECKGKQQ